MFSKRNLKTFFLFNLKYVALYTQRCVQHTRIILVCMCYYGFRNNFTWVWKTNQTFFFYKITVNNIIGTKKKKSTKTRMLLILFFIVLYIVTRLQFVYLRCTRGVSEIFITFLGKLLLLIFRVHQQYIASFSASRVGANL